MTITYIVESNDNSTYDSDLLYASDANNGYLTLRGDDAVKAVTLTNPFKYNDTLYTTVYINTNGTIGFNDAANTKAFFAYPPTAANMAAFFLPWLDTFDLDNIYYKEDVNSKTFTVIFNRKYTFNWSNLYAYQTGIKLFLDGSGKAIINVGTMGGVVPANTYLGFSFASGSTANFTTTSLVGQFAPPTSPLINLSQNQTSWNGKQIVITTVVSTPPTLGALLLPPPQVYGQPPWMLTDPTSDSPGLFSYASSDAAVATISGNTITVVGPGTTTITATQEAAGTFDSATTSAELQVLPATPNNPAPVASSSDVQFFLGTSSKYAEFASGQIDLQSSTLQATTTPKTLTGDNTVIRRVPHL